MVYDIKLFQKISFVLAWNQCLRKLNHVILVSWRQNLHTLNNIMPHVSLYTPSNIRKPLRIFMLSVGYRKRQVAWNGLRPLIWWSYKLQTRTCHLSYFRGVSTEIRSSLRFSHWPRQHLVVQSQQWNYYNNMWNLFKVNNKDTGPTSRTKIAFTCSKSAAMELLEQYVRFVQS